MHLGRVMDELAAALATIDGLRTWEYPPDRITPPAAVVEWPESITYDATMGRGMDTIVFPVWVMVGGSDARSQRDALAPYLDGAGPQSVKAAIEAHISIAYDSARVTGVPNGAKPVSIAGVDYLAAVLDVEVTGKGS